MDDCDRVDAAGRRIASRIGAARFSQVCQILKVFFFIHV
jgi:hypothetical protein